MADIGKFELGQVVGIPCDVKPGAFSGEYLVTIDTKTGPISGFVRTERLSGGEGGITYLRGVVQEVTEDTVTVRIHGSFFTTTGLAYLQSEWARSNLADLAQA